MAYADWYGIKVRKGEKYGKVVSDVNGWYRTLGVLMDDGSRETIAINNVGPDSEAVHEWEWYCVTREYEKWYRF